MAPADFKLEPHPAIPPPDGPVLVCILDGWGVNVEDGFNAVFSADTPVTDGLKAVPGRYRSVKAHGTAVGLPSDADMGNSEVGHNALGSGQVIDQGARLVDLALESGQMFELPGWKLISQAFADHTVHFIGLLSDGGVHSRYDQLIGCVRGAVERGAKRVRVHILTDGRDVPDGSSIGFATQLVADLDALAPLGCDAKIASGGGRMCVTMDRYEADWNIVKRGWDAHVLGVAEHKFTDPVAGLKELRVRAARGRGRGGRGGAQRAAGCALSAPRRAARRAPQGPSDDPVSDQWLPPFVIVDDAGTPVGTIEDGDAVVLFNFRADRMVEISKAFEYPDFDIFDRVRFPKDLKFVGMMQYDGDLLLPKNFLVPPPEISKTSGEYLVHNGVSTFACSETQKFGHVTFFWNGNRSGYFDSNLETFLEIPSDKVPFNQKPDMKAYEITEAGKEALRSGKYKMVRINYANPDMVGHTGDLAASIHACAVVDKCVGELLEVCNEMNGRFLVTSDHGNSDDMVQREKKTNKPLMDADTGKPLPLTSHTLAPVPVYVGGKGLPEGVVMRDDLPGAGLANITATYLNLLGLQAPPHYQDSLITTK
ncbi:2-3-bisphosphoglycerate-independent phosphoglycerate mutase [Scenedesmus sp. PABB004]|nr:2-3-bisphosphoglycerate-independent phosphoglycerate mutase [Scenedesmus sp. PABB004]